MGPGGFQTRSADFAGARGQSTLDCLFGQNRAFLVAVGLSWAGAAFGLSVNADGPAGVLRLKILDAASGQPSPCTVAILDATGRVVTNGESFASGIRSDGPLEIPLPPGPTRVTVSRGFEFRAVERSLTVPANAAVDVAIRLERVVDLRRLGWFAGDSHVHMLHGERTVPVTFDDVALAARAEDLQYLSLAQAWSEPSPTPERLASELAQRSTPDCVLAWNLEAPKNYYHGDAARCLGHCWTLGLNGRTRDGRDVIQLLLQASAHDYEVDKPACANFESHNLIHACGGAVFYTHPARWWIGPWGGQAGYPRQESMRVSNLAVELPLDVLAGPTFDGMDLITTGGEFEANKSAFAVWALLLNHGYRLAGTASSDACFDRRGGAVPGVVRTYTHLDGPFSVPAVAAAMKAGRNFATSGPLLLASVDETPPGSSFPADGSSRRLHVQAWASGTDRGGLTRLEVMRNGVLHRRLPLTPGAASADAVMDLRETGDAWYCVRAFGSDPRRQRAISGAFFFGEPTDQRPKPVPARIHAVMEDASTGARLAGVLTEVCFEGLVPRDGATHAVAQGACDLEIPATFRLRASSDGYRPVTLSPYLDNPSLLGFITGLTAEDLGRWETFEHVRQALGDISLTFRLEKE